MKRFDYLRMGIAAAAVAGCSQGSLAPDGVSGTVGDPIAARQAYVVQATYRPMRDGGTASGGVGTGMGSHTFTMVVDPIAQIAIVERDTIPLQRIDDRSFRTAGSFGVGTTAACTSVRYDEVTFTPGSTGISGSGRGQEATAYSDLGSQMPVEMTFTGGLDTVAPSVTFFGSNSVDPLLGYGVSLSESVLPSATATLVPSAGAPIALTPMLTNDGQAVVGFEKPDVGLRYDERYSLITDGIVDFGGNLVRSASVGTFTTRAAPPLIAEDGFESAADGELEQSQIVSGSAWPIIAGNRSLYSSASAGTFSPLSLRIALAPGDTTVRFSYRVVTSAATGFLGSVTLFVGTVGGPRGWLTLPAENGPLTSFQRPNNEPAIYLGEVKMAEIPIPAGSTGDLVIQRLAPASVSTCGGLPQPPSPGLVIDELRAD